MVRRGVYAAAPKKHSLLSNICHEKSKRHFKSFSSKLNEAETQRLKFKSASANLLNAMLKCAVSLNSATQIQRFLDCWCKKVKIP
jgi:hypothetical protein